MVFPVLDGKVAIVTGAAMGMGEATARLFAQAGAKVVVADFNAEKGRQVANAICQDGGEALFVEVDISEANQVERMVAETVEAFGRFDAAVNNAALTPDDKAVAESDEDYWDRLMGVDLKGTALCMEYGDLDIRVNSVPPGAIDTPMLRGALEQFGLTEEDYAPQLSLLGRFGQPEEVAQASLWLASDQSSYVTGTTLHVDAGYTSR